jgi:hypothetical protein
VPQERFKVLKVFKVQKDHQDLTGLEVHKVLKEMSVHKDSKDQQVFLL